jgi:serine/threonine protein kinase
VTYERFGRYKVLECLGAGGMATVHRATIDIGNGVIHEVALKRLLPQLADEKSLVDDFVREAKLAAQLQHPNIVRILELGRNGPTYFIAMELVRGHSLLALMKILNARRSTAPIGIIVALLSDLLDAIDYASNATGHDGEPLEIVHRDLSPSNLIITDEGVLKIIDFGVAKSLSGKFMTSSGMVKGKFGYMALEVLAAKPIDRRADIFSIGVVAWELITCRRLFTGANEYDVITKIRNGCTTPPSTFNVECTPELDEIVMHALSRERDERWPSAAVMKRALDTLRRTYRHGVRELVAWKRSLVPELVVEEVTSTEHELSMADMIVTRPEPRVSEKSITDTVVRAPEVNVDPEPTELSTMLDPGLNLDGD